MDQNFVIAYQYFLKKRRLYQATGTNQSFIIRCWYFSFCYLFVSYPVFSCACGALGLLLWYKSKKHKGSVTFWFDRELPDVLIIYLCRNFLVDGCKIEPGFIEDGRVNK